MGGKTVKTLCNLKKKKKNYKKECTFFYFLGKN